VEGCQEVTTPNTKIDQHGYLRYKDSNYLVHKRVKEKELGRRLLKGEIIHHINRNKLDNRPQNLELLTAKEHYKKHVVPLLEERRQAQLTEKLTPKIEAQAVNTILIGFAILGAILFLLGLIIRVKLDIWYLGLVFLLAALVAWFFKWRNK